MASRCKAFLSLLIFAGVVCSTAATTAAAEQALEWSSPSSDDAGHGTWLASEPAPFESEDSTKDGDMPLTGMLAACSSVDPAVESPPTSSRFAALNGPTDPAIATAQPRGPPV